MKYSILILFLYCSKDKSAKAKMTVKQYVITLEQTYLFRKDKITFILFILSSIDRL
nr:MAG TPA: hypothetical protein [Caudoviricetes sp.]